MQFFFRFSGHRGIAANEMADRETHTAATDPKRTVETTKVAKVTDHINSWATKRNKKNTLNSIGVRHRHLK